MMSPLKSITQNLPGFVREPAIALIGQDCYTTLVYNLDLDDATCLRYALSKVLGVGIVAGGGIVKVPQIIKIVRSRSASGLSLSSYLLDTASLLLTVAYNVRLDFPLSTYGENIALTIQNVIIIILILYLSPAFAKQALTAARSGSPWLHIVLFLSIIIAASYVLASETLTPIPLLRTLVAASIPLSLSAKVPQIIQNFRNRSTGQLSAFLVFNSLAGCIARLFTTSTETGDATLWWGFFSAAALNGVIAAQMIYYWNADSGAPVVKERDRREDAMRVPMASSPQAGAGPSPKTANHHPTLAGKPPAGRWQRKAE